GVVMKAFGIIFGTLVLLFGTTYVLLFTPPGNKIVAPIVEGKINEAIPLETALETFELGFGTFNVVLQLTPNNRVEVSGTYGVVDQSIHADYRLRLDTLKELEALTVQPLYGMLHVDGKVEGTLDRLGVSGFSEVAQSRTTFEASIIDLSPAKVIASVKHAQVNDLLAMVGQPPLLSGSLNIDAKLNDLNPESLDGVASIRLDSGKLNKKLMKRDYKIDLPDASFDTTANAVLDGQKVIYDLDVASKLANITSKGNLIPSTMAMNLNYDVAVKELGLFAAMTPIPLHGPLNLKGKVLGDEKKMNVTGTSDIAKSATTYDVTLTQFQPQRVIARIDNGHVEALLKMLGEAPIVSGTFDLDAKLNNLDPKNLDGTFALKLPKGTVNKKILKRDYKLDLPKTGFSADADALLKGDTATYDLKVRSAVANVTSKGDVKPATMAMDLNYDLFLKELGMLKSVTPIPMRGAIATKGTVKGDQKKLNVNGTTDIADSKSSYAVVLEEFKPRSAKASIKNAKVKSLLHMLAQPHYADGLINIEADLPDARMDRLDGTVNTSVTKGLVNGTLVSKQFDFLPMPKTTFATETTSKLSGHTVTTHSNVKSTLANVTGKKATVDLNTGYVRADYRVDVPDLNKLYFITERPLKGGITLTGDMVKEKDLDITSHSDTLGGTLDVKMHNDDIHAVIKNVQTLEALKMLTYPEIFKSTMNGTFDYNVIKQKGTFKADLNNGIFTRNIMLDLLQQMAGMDLYKERFTGTVNSAIVKEEITTNLDLRANKSSISGKDIYLNSKTKQVRANLDVVANRNPVSVKIKGSVDSPKVNLDLSDLAEKEAKEAVEKEVQKLFKKLF
ncbi:MAG: hypothetical protein R3302_05935, partial [Sulfurimonadaceae bacterium]|nr:hypothetical protein [Sulfurimonadaceae bacterium]